MTTTALWSRAQQQDFRARVRGCLLGGAIGDALGAGIEFHSLGTIRDHHGPAGVRDYVRAYGRRGAVTDDTQMTLFTVDGLIRAAIRGGSGGGSAPEEVHRAYLRWRATQRYEAPDLDDPALGRLGRQEWLYSRRAPGNACLSGLDDDRMGTLTAPKNRESKGCGTVMRSAPFGLLVDREPAQVFHLAAECAAQTHGHPSGVLAAAAFAAIVHGIVRGGTLEGAVHEALGLLAGWSGSEETTAALRQALDAVRRGAPSAERLEGLGQGWVAEEALAMGVYCALVAEDIRHGLLLAVNHSGDSDSTGSLCGNLLGALHGETALPVDLLAELEGRAEIAELADDFAMELTQGAHLHGPDVTSTAWTERYPLA
ncbi:ADP-ribosylglycohydrolase [Streptosporangium nondiastaticum]|uniref:ADP-ribosylglycohydrolase n=1 Tax=Streptosporangium nondiastaticum TaxID=35764 RepID=A0A9X7PE90_9ACTN|nr:ADP-ribosylglycohydrolase family protein [Streptosporangium nondiastaticum]PSJ24596.1 ADP-ribosylglycohydrolase [Streptosporangium nondiastaticum]